MLGLEVFKERRCSTCTIKDQKKYGCDEDIRPFYFDKKEITRCPLRPFKEDPQFFSDIFRLYSYREKGFMAETGGVYDQPNYYFEIMSDMDQAVSDSYTIKEDMKREEDKQLEQLRKAGINFTKK